LGSGPRTDSTALWNPKKPDILFFNGFLCYPD